MSIDTFKTILREFYEEPLPENIIYRDIDIPFDTGLIISIIGCRRTGKTTFLKQQVKELIKRGISQEQIVFINFEDERIERTKEIFDDLLLAHAELYPEINSSKCWYFFDEIQEIPGWEKFVRRVHETKSKNIILTGSNSRLLSREIATTLRGRTISYEIFPFSFREFLQFKGINPENTHTTKEKAIIRNNFNEYLRQGGFPETINQVTSTKTKLFRSYLDVMIYRDLIERYKIRNHEALKAFITKRVANISKENSIHKTYREMKSAGYEISKDSLYKMNAWCEEIFLLFNLKQYHESAIKQQNTGKKSYCIDNGMVVYTSFRTGEDKVRLLENAVFLALRRKNEEIYYHKDRKECDFLIAEQGRIIHAIQVTVALRDPTTRKREIDGILQVLKRAGRTIKASIITLEEEETIVEEGVTIEVIPVIKWLLQE